MVAAVGVAGCVVAREEVERQAVVGDLECSVVGAGDRSERARHAVAGGRSRSGGHGQGRPLGQAAAAAGALAAAGRVAGEGIDRHSVGTGDQDRLTADGLRHHGRRSGGGRRDGSLGHDGSGGHAADSLGGARSAAAAGADDRGDGEEARGHLDQSTRGCWSVHLENLWLLVLSSGISACPENRFATWRSPRTPVPKSAGPWSDADPGPGPYPWWPARHLQWPEPSAQEETVVRSRTASLAARAGAWPRRLSLRRLWFGLANLSLARRFLIVSLVLVVTGGVAVGWVDRKSTRLNSSHANI